MTRRSSKIGRIDDPNGTLVDDIDALYERLEKLETPGGEARAAGLAKIGASIDELLTRVTLSQEEIYDRQINVGETLPAETGTLAPIAFTLTDRRRCYFRMSVYGGMTIWSNGGSPNVDPYALGRIRIDLLEVATGITTSTTSPISTGCGWISGLRTMSRHTSRFFLDDYRILNPGDYVVSFSAAVEQLDGLNGWIRYVNPRVAVEIMEKA